MPNKRILEKLKVILARELRVDADKISEASVLTSDLGADSLDLAEIALVIKEEFQYDMSDQDIQKIQTVSDMCSMLSKVTEKEAA